MMARESREDARVLKEVYESFDAIASSLPDHMREEFAELLLTVTYHVPVGLPGLVLNWRKTNGYGRRDVLPEPSGRVVPDHDQETGTAHALHGYLQAYGMAKGGV